MTAGDVHCARFAELDPATLYALLRLRVDVFVVEQACPYPELDGRDLEPATRHLWLEDAGVPVAYLRLLDDGRDAGAGRLGLYRIGRVATAASHRNQGVATVLVRAALELCHGPVVLDAQAHLQPWYERLGFAATGPVYVDADGIPHVPMRLAR